MKLYVDGCLVGHCTKATFSGMEGQRIEDDEGIVAQGRVIVIEAEEEISSPNKASFLSRLRDRIFKGIVR